MSYTYTFKDDANELFSDLQQINDTGSDVERALRMFSSQVAGKSLNAFGICLKWFLIVNELKSNAGAPPFIVGILTMVFEDIVNEYFEDTPEFKSELITAFQKVTT